MPFELLGWGAQEWSALGDMLLGVGAVSAGLWTLFNYRKNRRVEAARWLHGVFRDFYLDDRFAEVRATLEYEYRDQAGPLLERRLTDRDVQLTERDQELLFQLDTLLNYFEHVLYLEHEKHLEKRDRQAIFEYWFEVLSSDDCAALRRYAASFGFERVADTLQARQPDYIAVYGSLMSGLTLNDKPELEGLAKLVGSCRIPGQLLDLGDYPGLDDCQPGSVVGELYEVLNKQVFAVMDRFERYDPHHRADSLYLRRCIRLQEPRVDTWVYVFNGEASDRSPVPSGDWRRHLQARASNSTSGTSPTL
jgi:gamma-glutamylcyclotransferase (GGCT)/AIG2-like uncharacterized protein YtfP